MSNTCLIGLTKENGDTSKLQGLSPRVLHAFRNSKDTETRRAVKGNHDKAAS